MSKERPVITIEAHEIPSKLFSIGVVEPLYEERRLASKRMPAPTSGQKVGYTTTQLMVAMCIKEVNGQLVPTDARDPIAILRSMASDDSQFIIAAFISAFIVDDNLSEEIKEFSTQLKESTNGFTYTIPKDRLPNKTASITFRRPRTDDQIKMERKYPGAETNPGFTIEELLFAHCIEALDGVEADKPKDLVSLFDHWPLIDQQYAQMVFNNLAYIDKDDYDKAEDLGKSLRDRGRGSKTTTAGQEKTDSTITKSK